MEYKNNTIIINIICIPSPCMDFGETAFANEGISPWLTIMPTRFSRIKRKEGIYTLAIETVSPGKSHPKLMPVYMYVHVYSVIYSATVYFYIVA